MINYQTMPEEEIVHEGRRGNMEAVEYLLDKYRGMIKRKSREYYIIGGDGEDIIQEGMMALFEAIKCFDEKKGASFYSFANLCVTRRIINLVKHDNTLSYGILNNYVAFDEYEQNAVKFESSPEENIVEKENEQLLRDKLLKSFSKYEIQVFDLFLDGYDYVDIASKLGKTPKSVDNAIQRMKKKAKNNLGHE